MILICCEGLALLDLRLNVDKSVALRMGKGWKLNCCVLNIPESAMGHRNKIFGSVFDGRPHIFL